MCVARISVIALQLQVAIDVRASTQLLIVGPHKESDLRLRCLRRAAVSRNKTIVVHRKIETSALAGGRQPPTKVLRLRAIV
jgi:hypothetical protein